MKNIRFLSNEIRNTRAALNLLECGEESRARAELVGPARLEAEQVVDLVAARLDTLLDEQKRLTQLPPPPLKARLVFRPTKNRSQQASV